MRILYLSHCDWDWARQRPQQLAAALAEHGHEVHVRYRPFIRRKNLVHRPSDADSGLRSLRAAWWLVPTRFATIHPLLLGASKLAIRLLSRKLRPDVIWYSSPELEPVAVAVGTPTLWDCMDLTSLMRSHDETWSARVRHLEGLASQSASAVVVSSALLAAEVGRQSLDQTKIFTVHNGFASAMAWPVESLPSPNLVGAYFGTVAEWFDFELVLELLAAEPRLEFRIIGPCVVEIPVHPRLRYLGVMAHADLPAATVDVDFFMMPFRVSRLIEAVDPVKLYEYVASGRPAFAPQYPEIERFSPFVSLYESNFECLRLVHQMVQGERLEDDSAERTRFLLANSWEERSREATEALDWAVHIRCAPVTGG